jgi:hypothetical protein
MEKPKTSTLDRMSETDLLLVNRLVVICGNYYERITNPPKNGPHSSLEELDKLKSELLLTSLKVGERIWYPRGNPGLTTTLHAPRSKKNGR